MFVFSVPIGFYGLQHYLSMLGSLILVPLVIVPAMGGSHVSVILLDSLLWTMMIANVISTFFLDYRRRLQMLYRLYFLSLESLHCCILRLGRGFL